LNSHFIRLIAAPSGDGIGGRPELEERAATGRTRRTPAGYLGTCHDSGPADYEMVK
jgi:hypothetical protein